MVLRLALALRDRRPGIIHLGKRSLGRSRPVECPGAHGCQHPLQGGRQQPQERNASSSEKKKGESVKKMEHDASSAAIHRLTILVGFQRDSKSTFNFGFKDKIWGRKGFTVGTKHGKFLRGQCEGSLQVGMTGELKLEVLDKFRCCSLRLHDWKIM